MSEFNDKPGYAFGQELPREISGYLANKTATPSFSWKDVEPEEHAVQFAVAKATSLDVLGAIKGALVKAQADGLPFETFQRELRPRLEKLGWWGIGEAKDPLTGEVRPVRLGTPRRLKTIYDANLRTARAAGEWQRIQRTKLGLPYLRYELGPSENHRPLHVAREGIILPVDDPFWKIWYPPNGWGCKCRVRQISRREAERLGGVTESPEIVMREWINSRTGEAKWVAEGIDPGWDRNPGIERGRWAELHLQGKLEAADEDIAQTLAADMIDSWRFQRLREGGVVGSVPVAVISDAAQKTLGAKTRVVSFSNTTGQKLRDRHPEVKLDTYRFVADAFEKGLVYKHDGSIVIFRSDLIGKVWKLVLRRTADANEVFIRTLHRSNKNQRDKFGRKADVTKVKDAPGGS